MFRGVLEMENISKHEYDSMVCPFVTGGKVTGEKFIGRGEYIKRCIRKLKGRNSIALRGIPRIGKSSLAIRLLDIMKELEEEVIISLYIDLSNCSSFLHFWQETVKALEAELSTDDSEMIRLLSVVKNKADSYETMKDAVEKLFTYTCRQGKRVVLCIDEFDSASSVLMDNTAGPLCNFMFMRTMMTSTREYGLSFIIVTRRSLSSIESKADGGSTFDGAIETMPVRGFSDNELSEFREYGEKHGVFLSDEEWDMFVGQAGRSPFMLSRTAMALLDSEVGLVSKRRCTTTIRRTTRILTDC